MACACRTPAKLGSIIDEAWETRTGYCPQNRSSAISYRYRCAHQVINGPLTAYVYTWRRAPSGTMPTAVIPRESGESSTPGARRDPWRKSRKRHGVPGPPLSRGTTCGESEILSQLFRDIAAGKA